MASPIIPKEQLTAYQRWELGSLDDPEPPATVPAEPESLVEETPALRLPTAEELEQIHQAAWQEGYRLGYEEGRREGEEYARKLRALFEGMEPARLREDEALAREVLELAIAIARQIVGASLRVRPELMLAIVKEALHQLPHLSGHPKLVAHPDDASLLREWLAQEQGHLNWRVIEDPQMEPGGFRVESGQGELDASLPTRWKETLLALGADPAWLE